MLTVHEVRSMTGVVLPVYFDPSIDRKTVAALLQVTLREQAQFCRPDWTTLVVDQGTTAHHVLDRLAPELGLSDSRLVLLPRNQGKTGAVREGLRKLLETDCRYLVTRDCDGDHSLYDLPRLLQVAEEIRLAVRPTCLSVFGSRPSLARPMNWQRQEWERLTNRVFQSVVEYLLARADKVLDRRFWNGYPLDLQSGSRLYDRQGARLAVESLEDLPDERRVYLMACEMTPFVEISVQGGLIGQVQRMTRVRQPVSSYENLDFAASYGELLRYTAARYQLEPLTLLRIFDNHLLESEIFFSQLKGEALRCRNVLGGASTPVVHASVM